MFKHIVKRDKSPTPSPSPAGRGAVCSVAQILYGVSYTQDFIYCRFLYLTKHITPLPAGEGLGVGLFVIY